jgi:3D (Asp-Asp-Asp) domain-containing protein
MTPHAMGAGTLVGVFRNTYYDFPLESDYEGASVALMGASCSPIASVPRGFYETVCMQGSGLLRGGRAVSFARRGCDCAEVCPRSGEQICFEALDPHRFPWGRGATGKAITPLWTVAADTHVLPLGTHIYVAAFDGVPRSEGASERLDGCFVVEDRGVKIQGAHIDVFAGDEASRAYLNTVVPSNSGVTVAVDVAKCAR